MKYLLPVICLMLIAAPFLALAAPLDLKGPLDKVGSEAYGTTQPPELPQLIGRYVNIFLSILGVLMVILIVYGGYNWMTSFGETAKVKKAKDLITDAVIGIIIILAAYAIANFVVERLTKATTGTGA